MFLLVSKVVEKYHCQNNKFLFLVGKKVHNEEMFLVKERKLLPVYKLITIFSPILGRTL